MHLSLTLKLIVAFLFVSLIGTAFVALFAGRTTRTELDRLLLEQARTNFIADATSYYQQTGSWVGVSEAIRRLAQERRLEPPLSGRPGPPPPHLMPHFILVDPFGQVMHSGPPYQVGDLIPASLLEQGTSIEINGEVVGIVLSIDHTPQVDPREAEFIARINQALIYAALGATAIALILGFVLARTLTRPLRELTVAARTVAQGKLGQRVPIRTHDELGELAVSFNQMSADLAHANQLRRQMTADIAHDLRSPLAVLSGYIESLRDGIFEPSPSMFDVMYTETQHLQRLIEDLRTLSLADANELPLNRRPIAMQPLLDKLVTAYAHQAEQKQIALKLKIISDLPKINVDPERMTQVLGNLVNNAFRYTSKNGEIALSAQSQEQIMLLKVQDTGTGIAPDDLPHIFERFYRADKARQRDNGQSGLGLAIAKSIVEAHGGTISAESELGRGTTFSIELAVNTNGIK